LIILKERLNQMNDPRLDKIYNYIRTHERCNKTNQEFSEILGCSPRYISSALKNLRSLGLIETKTNHRKISSSWSNTRIITVIGENNAELPEN
jgi:Mn-dependent DtxR family transcriptional regulator